MVVDSIIKGEFVDLRSVTEDDASFILEIRNDSKISKFLPPLNITINQQRQWISNQKTDDNSYYFIILSKAGEKLGTISVYNIKNNTAETGRFCSIGDVFQNTEAIIMFNDFVYYDLNLDATYIWVYEENKPVISLNTRIGFEWVDVGIADDGRKYQTGRMTKMQYEKKAVMLKKHLSVIKQRA